MISEIYNIDCMEYMRSMPDKFFDLAIVDPPYGIGSDWKKRKNSNYKKTSYKNNKIPDKSYFDELRRVSCNQIIFGYNYFTQHLGSTNHLILWDKLASETTSFQSMFEIAYTSFKIPAYKICVPWDGARKGRETGIKKIHPHQKPIALYQELMSIFAKQGDKILDTHLGSGSSRIVAYRSEERRVGKAVRPQLSRPCTQEQ